MVDKQLILDSVGPVQAVLDAHDGVVNVVDTTDGVIMISLEGGCTGCSATPMTAMQIFYSLMKLDEVQDVVFVNGELPDYMRSFINDKLNSEYLVFVSSCLHDIVRICLSLDILSLYVHDRCYCHRYRNHCKWPCNVL